MVKNKTMRTRVNLRALKRNSTNKSSQINSKTGLTSKITGVSTSVTMSKSKNFNSSGCQKEESLSNSDNKFSNAEVSNSSNNVRARQPNKRKTPSPSTSYSKSNSSAPNSKLRLTVGKFSPKLLQNVVKCTTNGISKMADFSNVVAGNQRHPKVKNNSKIRFNNVRIGSKLPKIGKKKVKPLKLASKMSKFVTCIIQ